MGSFEIITLIFSGIVCISTVVYAKLTQKLVQESQLMREHHNTPDIQIFFEIAEADPSLIFIVFTNRGLGHAKNVKINILKDYGFYNDKKVELKTKGIIKNGLQNFYPGQKFKYFFTELVHEHEKKVKDNILFSVSYENLFSKKYNKEINLNLSEVDGAGVTNPPDNYLGRIPYELKGLKEAIKKNNK